jgi:hypothetical protein
MKKLWRGLFYCYWMSDKPLVQHELADRLSQFILPLTEANALCFADVFAWTMVREWPGIDRLRSVRGRCVCAALRRSAHCSLCGRSWVCCLLVTTD